MVAREMVHGELVKVDLRVEPDLDAISAVYPKAALPRLRALVQHLRDGLGDPPPWDRQLAEVGIISL
jgi:DNA-binding transcriptional LysR family regulator